MRTKSEDRVLYTPNNDVSSPKIPYLVPKDKGVAMPTSINFRGGADLSLKVRA